MKVVHKESKGLRHVVILSAQSPVLHVRLQKRNRLGLWQTIAGEIVTPSKFSSLRECDDEIERVMARNRERLPRFEAAESYLRHRTREATMDTL